MGHVCELIMLILCSITIVSSDDRQVVSNDNSQTLRVLSFIIGSGLRSCAEILFMCRMLWRQQEAIKSNFNYITNIALTMTTIMLSNIMICIVMYNDD